MIQFFLALFALVIVLVVVVAVFYNKLIAFRNMYINAFAQIDVQMTRRYDLIPNLVEGVRAYLKHEHETFLLVAQARQQATAELKSAAASPGDPRAMQQLSMADLALNSALSRLLAVVEAYPELKASQTIRDFNEELTSTENRVAFARQAYNDSVMEYNTLAEQFPSNFVAQAFNFKLAAMLEADTGKREVPKVKFD